MCFICPTRKLLFIDGDVLIYLNSSLPTCRAVEFLKQLEDLEGEACITENMEDECDEIVDGCGWNTDAGL